MNDPLAWQWIAACSTGFCKYYGAYSSFNLVAKLTPYKCFSTGSSTGLPSQRKCTHFEVCARLIAPKE